MARIIRASNRFIRNNCHLLDANLQMGILAGLTGFWVHSFFDTSFYNIKLNALMWLMMGFAIAFSKRHSDDRIVKAS
jgi:hypothetical protein